MSKTERLAGGLPPFHAGKARKIQLVWALGWSHHLFQLQARGKKKMFSRRGRRAQFHVWFALSVAKQGTSPWSLYNHEQVAMFTLGNCIKVI